VLHVGLHRVLRDEHRRGDLAVGLSLDDQRGDPALRFGESFHRGADRYRGQLVYEIGEITGALKQLAKDEGICVVLLHQLSRGVEQRDRKDRRPTMADLRSSGDIEADADVVALVYREAYYLKQSPEFHDDDPETLEAYFRCEHEADLILGKSRAGPTGVVKLWCDIGCNTFAAAARGGEA